MILRANRFFILHPIENISHSNLPLILHYFMNFCFFPVFLSHCGQFIPFSLQIKDLKEPTGSSHA
jgi:hypothetical protein